MDKKSITDILHNIINFIILIVYSWKDSFIIFILFSVCFRLIVSITVLVCFLFPFILFVKSLFDGPPQTKTNAKKQQNSETNKKDNVNIKESVGTCQSNHIDAGKTADSTPPTLSASSQHKSASVPVVAVTTADGQIQGAKVVTILADCFAWQTQPIQNIFNSDSFSRSR